MIFTARVYQDLIRDFALSHERANIFASMGMGKTSITVATYDELRFLGEVKRLLVLAPKRVAQSSWPDEVNIKWKESFGHLRIASAVGSLSNRLAALRSNPHILTTNYENAPWLIEQYKDEWPFDMVAADESTRLKGLRRSFQRRQRKDGTWGEEFITGQGASRARALADIAHSKVRRWLNLTGSPAPNGIIDLWGPQWFIDRGFTLGNAFDEFVNRWFYPTAKGDGYTSWEPKDHSQKQIEQMMRPWSITVDAKDYFDVKEPLEHHVMVDLPPQARKQYNEMQRKLFTLINNNPLEAVNAGVKSLKCMQILNGSVWMNEDDWEPVHDEKLDALGSVISECNGEPLLVSYLYKPDAMRILKKFPRAKLIDGKQKTIWDFQEGKIPILLVHPKSAGHGLDLQKNCRRLCDYSSGYDLEYDEQVLGRIGPVRQLQIGKVTDVWRYRIVARNTIEEHVVLPRVKHKMSVQEAFKAAMKVLS